jgi:hypothetical protein
MLSGGLSASFSNSSADDACLHPTLHDYATHLVFTPAVVADELLRKSLADAPILVPMPNVAENITPYRTTSYPGVG